MSTCSSSLARRSSEGGAWEARSLLAAGQIRGECGCRRAGRLIEGELPANLAAGVRRRVDVDVEVALQELREEKWGERLGEYIEVLERLFWPELIIVGGGVSAKHEKFFKFIKPRAKLVPAGFLNQAGIAGAAIWAGEAK